MKAYYHHQHHHSNKNAAVAVVTLVWLLLLGFVAGFGIAPLSSRTPLAAATRVATRATALQATTTPSDEEDVSIPYDSAARLAYDEWRAQFNKGPFDPKRYPNFQQNYETITVANVMAKKRAREEGTVSGIAANDYENVDENVLELLALNEYGDFSEDEYAQMAAASNPGLIPTTTTAAASTMTQPSSMSTGDVLTQAMEAAEMLSEASSALGEAADALAEEEEKLMALLGLESVEELEMALDSLEGIAPDGGELEPEPDNLAREARVREAYFKWCTLWNKNPDESRFRSFSNNFLLMEQYAKESSKEMTLNQYADFTKQEYEVFLRSGATAKPSSSSPSSSSSPVDAVVVSPVVSASVPSPSVPAPSIPAPAIVTPSISSVDGSVSEKTGLGKILELAAMKIENSLQEIDEKTATSEEREARSKAVADAQAKADLEASAARAKRAAEVLARAQEDVVRRKEIEEQRVARERVLAKEAEKIKTQAEASAIASARAQTEKEVARSAQRAAFDAQAAKEAREKARAWEEQQRQLRQLSSKAVPATKKPALNFFSPKPAVSIAKKTVSAPMVSPVVARPVTPKPAPSSLKLPSFSFFSPSPAPAIKKKVVVAQKPAPSPPSPASTSNKPAASNPFSFFPASNAPAPKAKSQPALTPVVVAPVKKAAEKSPSFSFFAPKPAVAIKKLTPVVVPAPAPAKPSPAFSFFGTGTPKKDVKVPARAGSISILPSKQKESKDIKVPVRAGTINVLKATGVNTKDMAKPTSQSFSLFGSTVPKPKPIPVSTPAPVSRSPSISLFGGLPRKADEKKADIKVPNRSGTISVKSSPKVEAKPAFSFFGGMSQSSSGTKSVAPASTKSTAPSGVPTLTQWRQGPDGSISGKVSNSKNYRNGTLITTSPVRKGAKAGSVVKTGSGSQYFLS